MSKKFKYTRHVSPRGMFKYAWVNKPDSYQGKEQFKVTHLMEDTEEVRAWCDKVMESAIEEAKKAGVKLKRKPASPFVYPEDIDEDDFVPEEGKDKPKYDEDYRGKIFFTTKTNFKPGAIDAHRQSLPDDVRIMSGDEGRVRVENNPYEGFGSGVSLRFVTIQLLEKNNTFSGEGYVDTDGFEDEDGYVAPAAEDEEDF